MQVTARDVRRALLRGALVAPTVALVGIVLQAGTIDPAWLSTAAVAGLLVAPMGLIELRAAARGGRAEPPEPFVVWILAAMSLFVCFVQHAYVSASLTARSFDAGLGEAWDAIAFTLGDSPFATALLLIALACPFPLAAHVRLRGFDPRSAVFLTAAFLLFPATCLSAGIVLGVVAAMVVALLVLYACADALEARLWSGASPEELARFAGRAADLPRSKVWLLAYLEHPGAGDALGFRAPEAPAELEPFMFGLEPAGRAACVRAAAACGAMVLPFLPHDETAPRAVAAVEAWLAESTAERRAAARAAIEGWTLDGPAARAVREAVFALEGEPPWATRVAVRAAKEAALAAAEVMTDPRGVKDGVRGALLAWALGEDRQGDARAPSR